MADGKVGQVAAANADGSFPAYRQNRRAELIVPDWFGEMVQEGRVFSCSNPTKQTAVNVATTTFADTTPFLHIDVPSGTTMIPLEVYMNQGGTVGSAVQTLILSKDNKLRYSSGGTLLTARNNRTDDPIAATCTAYTGATLNAVGREMTIYAKLMSFDVIHAITTTNDTQVLWRASIPDYLVGPASFQIYDAAATTTSSWYYRVVWAEFGSTLIV